MGTDKPETGSASTGGPVCFALAKGCPRSKSSMSTLVEYFRANGWKATTDAGQADLVVFGCCAFDAYNEEASFRYLELIMKKKRPGARIVVFGCLPGINPARLHERFDVTAVASKDIAEFDGIIGASTKLRDVREPNDLTPYIEQFGRCFSMVDHALVRLRLAGMFHNKVLDRFTLYGWRRPFSASYKNVYEIKIGKGCMGKCSYCAIRFAAGPVRSKPAEKIISEFDAGLKAGYRTFRLIADDVGAYGADTGGNIAGLLGRIFDNDEKFELMWDDFSPKWLIGYYPELSKILQANSGRIGYVGFPMQSGSENIIRLMNREYKVKEAMDCMGAIKEKAPSINITTHLIVGFPGEDEAGFNDTLEVIRDGNFRDVDLYSYCDRPNADSALMTGKVDERVKASRIRKARKLVRSVLARGVAA